MKDKLELIKRNLKEIIGEADLKKKFNSKKEFSVYSNSDFFLLQSSSTSIIEIRIDPTREKSAMNSQKDLIAVQLR